MSGISSEAERYFYTVDVGVSKSSSRTNGHVAQLAEATVSNAVQVWVQLPP